MAALIPSSFKKISHSVTSKFHVGEKLGMPPAITLTTKIKLALIFFQNIKQKSNNHAPNVHSS